MCKLSPSSSSSSLVADNASSVSASSSSTSLAGASTSWISSMASVVTRPRRLSTILLGIVCCLVFSLVVLYMTSISFRRSVIFWKGMAPIYLEYKWIKFRKPSMPIEEYETKLHAFYERAAETLVNLILRLGGIATKIGQVLATIGQGLLPNEIVSALRVLQDGVPAKSYEEVASIITEAAKERHFSNNIDKSPPPTMEDLFEWFDPKPIGAASIAQAHLAGLKTTNETVVVKVQYPEVIHQLDADLWNMEMAVKLISPENKELADALRERHERELDFTLEADHLRECAYNLQQHGVEPNLVRIPRVRNETGLCSTNILVMEYIPGTPLSKILVQEQERLARALGKSPADLQRYLTDQLAQTQGGAQDDDDKDNSNMQDDNPFAFLQRKKSPRGGGGGARESEPWWMKPSVQEAVYKTAPLWTRVFRTYASVRDSVDQLGASLQRAINPISWTKTPAPSPRRHKANLSRVLRTLVHVHGLQMLMDGVYNVDPHPGNILIMPDGRLGLIDYGMIGRFSESDRRNAVDTILALADGQIEETSSIYKRSGYKAKILGTSGMLEDSAVLHRLATFHFDRIDLSPVTWSSTGKTQDILKLLNGVVETSIPKWIEDGRRLGALMMGPHIQSGRTFSLAQSWKGIARRAKAEMTTSSE